MLNVMFKNLYEAVENFCTRGNKEGLTIEEYKNVMNTHWENVRTEENRIREIKGHIRTQHLREGKEYLIQDLENDIMRDILINPNEKFVSIIPKYKDKFTYTSYEFEKTSYETVKFISRTSHS